MEFSRPKYSQTTNTMCTVIFSYSDTLGLFQELVSRHLPTDDKQQSVLKTLQKEKCQPFAVQQVFI